MIRIIDIQARATIQDLGRFGLRQYGIGHSGAMDSLALKAGNLLLGNAENSPAVEIPLGAMTVLFERDISFCVTGAFYEMFLDNEPVYSYWRYNAKAGQILRFVCARAGMYSYFCVRGGFKIEPELGSCSTDIRVQLGGIEGRPLQAGDCLKTRTDQRLLPQIGIAPIELTQYIHAVPSSEYAHFKRKSQYKLWQNSWRLQSNSDRMGYRFQGDALTLIKPLEMLSHAIQFGTVQVPPDGQPIVLMADAQTTGGYPKIACVVQSDLGRLAQVRLGSSIKFTAVTVQEAQKLRQKDQIYLNHIRRIVNESN
ncbi:5-oxoprolinase/urea amidolyase family protein [Pasteurellaceae bacterium LIM206]|nr:5-oxoprolinase/urea amidolyase family protein [Pasteurellaceae bacterium LIM206]